MASSGLTAQLVHQPVGADDLAGVQRGDGEQGLLSGAAHLCGQAVALDDHRPEQPDPHVPSRRPAGLPPGAVSRGRGRRRPGSARC